MNTYLQVNVDGMMVARVQFCDQKGEPNLEWADCLRGSQSATFGKQAAAEFRALFLRMYPSAQFHVYRASDA